MKRIITLLSICGLLTILASCNSKPSLQKYYITNQENQNFMVIDIPTSVLNINVDSLTSTQQKAFTSIEKLNFLGFKKTDNNTTIYETERDNVKQILSDNSYKSLIKYGGEKQGAIIKYLGEDEAIDEVVIFGNDNSQGFGIIRVIGNDMNPAHVLDLIEVVKQSKPDKEAFESIANFF
ncbi:MAG: DUF4252 domain-containing protein [Flavobacteriaceae bacterium]